MHRRWYYTISNYTRLCCPIPSRFVYMDVKIKSRHGEVTIINQTKTRRASQFGLRMSQWS